WNDTSREVHEMFKTTAIDTLKQDKKCQACWYMILSTMSGSTTPNYALRWSTHSCSSRSSIFGKFLPQSEQEYFGLDLVFIVWFSFVIGHLVSSERCALRLSFY
ncbi:MAG: hypothetical protein WAM42_26015, partial [Candidatus Nitrosopolaris sp.]